MRMTTAVTIATLLVSGAAANAETTAADTIDALNGVFGKHAGARASHAKGFCAVGEFVPTAEAAHFSSTPLFAKTSKATVRFSIGGGNPAMSDKAKPAVKGLGIKIHAEKGDTDLVMVNTPMFFAKTPEQFVEFLKVRKADPATGKPDQAKLEAFNHANPETLGPTKYLMSRPLPASYATTSYFAIHTFEFANAHGKTQPARWRFIPSAGEHGLTDEEAKALSDNFLTPELEARIAKGPVSWEVELQLPEAGDDLVNPTIAWPDTRKTVKVGKFSVTALAAKDSCDGLVFDPNNLTDGITGSKDPTLTIRSAAYAESLTRRSVTNK